MSSETPPPLVKEARKQLAAQIRDDWVFEWARHDTSNTLYSNPDDSQPLPGLETTPAQPAIGRVEIWRERTYASSDPPSDEDQEGPDAHPPQTPSSDHEVRKKSFAASIASSFSKFHSAPSLAEQRTRERRRKRQRRNEEEMGWNDGLAHWTAQRDAWSCAKRVRNEPPDSDAASTTTTTTTTGNKPQVPGLPSPPSSTSVSPHPDPPFLSTTTFLPVAPPLLPVTDPTRASITPTLYPSIYQKVVLQSLAPTVPINLSHLIPALVEGWKRDGEWPPKSSATSVAAAHRAILGRSTSHREAMAAVAGGGGGSSSGKKYAASGGGANSNGHNLFTMLSEGSASAGQKLGRRGKRLFVQRGGEGGGFGNRNVSVAKADGGVGANGIVSIPVEDEEDCVAGPQPFGTRSKDVAKRVGRKLRMSLSGGSATGNSDAADGNW